jgi:hypothetical protein
MMYDGGGGGGGGGGGDNDDDDGDLPAAAVATIECKPRDLNLPNFQRIQFATVLLCVYIFATVLYGVTCRSEQHCGTR